MGPALALMRLQVRDDVLGRPKLYAERILLPLPAGTTARIDALLEDGEYRLDLIRTAIETEVEKRVKAKDEPVGQ